MSFSTELDYQWDDYDFRSDELTTLSCLSSSRWVPTISMAAVMITLANQRKTVAKV